jgi:hypothetical protein
MQARRWILRVIVLAEWVVKAKVGEKVIEQVASARPSRIDAGEYRRTLTGAEAEVRRMSFRTSLH